MCPPPADGSLYSATVADFQASDAVIYRSLSPGQAPLRTLKYSSRWLQGTPKWGGLWGWDGGTGGCGAGVTGVEGWGRVGQGDVGLWGWGRGVQGCNLGVQDRGDVEGAGRREAAEHKGVGQGQEVAGADGPSDLPWPPQNPTLSRCCPTAPMSTSSSGRWQWSSAPWARWVRGWGAPRSPPPWGQGRGEP